MVESAIRGGLWELTGLPGESSYEGLPLKATIPAIHAAFEHIRSRVYCFRDFVRIRPEIGLQMHQQIGQADRQELVKKITR